MGTRTGHFPIGFRRGWSDWQKKDLGALAAWARKEGFDVIDDPGADAAAVATLKKAEIALGTVDLLDFGNLCSTDEAKRKDVQAKNIERINALAPLGVKKYFACVIPGDGSKPRNENYDLAVKAYAPIAAACAKVGATVYLEGWPGGGPNYPVLCCTPETYRRIFQDIPQGLGVNYDPSHLIRLGVDHIRFAQEFVSKIGHVHAKDTEIMADAVYEYGLYQSAAFAKKHGFGENVWRYTIPGHGQTRWTRLFEILAAANYKGAVCIELEDENFNGTEAGEKTALSTSLKFLQSA
ncbi:MAG: sugar phosphate isomerase/epimerase family protein [Planctomycetota bacterium]